MCLIRRGLLIQSDRSDERQLTSRCVGQVASARSRSACLSPSPWVSVNRRNVTGKNKLCDKHCCAYGSWTLVSVSVNCHNVLLAGLKLQTFVYSYGNKYRIHLHLKTMVYMTSLSRSNTISLTKWCIYHKICDKSDHQRAHIKYAGVSYLEERFCLIFVWLR